MVDEDTCHWLEVIEGRVVSGNDRVNLKNMDVAACKKACEEQETYKCMSFDYRPGTSECWLQTVDRFSARLTTSSTFNYYERDCRGQWPLLYSMSDLCICTLMNPSIGEIVIGIRQCRDHGSARFHLCCGMLGPCTCSLFLSYQPFDIHV